MVEAVSKVTQHISENSKKRIFWICGFLTLFAGVLRFFAGFLRVIPVNFFQFSTTKTDFRDVCVDHK